MEIAASEVLLTGILLKIILNLKDNYFGLYDEVRPPHSFLGFVPSTDAVQISEPLRKSPPHITLRIADSAENVEKYRSLDVFFKLQVNDLSAHCLTALLGGDQPVCSIARTKQLVVELKKDHSAALVQVQAIDLSLQLSNLHYILR